jgi:hypothetical protein
VISASLFPKTIQLPIFFSSDLEPASNGFLSGKNEVKLDLFIIPRIYGFIQFHPQSLPNVLESSAPIPDGMVAYVSEYTDFVLSQSIRR